MIMESSWTRVEGTFGETPLFLALWGKHTDVANLLMFAGADINKGTHSRSILESAVDKKNVDLIHTILSKRDACVSESLRIEILKLSVSKNCPDLEALVDKAEIIRDDVYRAFIEL